MKCWMCESDMKKTVVDYHYDMSGLKYVHINNCVVWVCTGCDEDGVEIHNIYELHQSIAGHIATFGTLLLPEEIRFMRKHLGFSGVDFARTMGVSPETVSRWETGKKQMGSSAERLLRVLILSNVGPFRDYEEMDKFGTKKGKSRKKLSLKVSKKGWKVVV